MRTGNTATSVARALRFLAGFVMAVMGGQCDYTAYPLKPTFCDDWCRVLLRAGCDQEPENCVRSCEQSQGPRECRPFHERLLACYQSAPPNAFICSGRGFQQIARPEESVCRSERDALIDCAYPSMTDCLTTCRSLEAVYAATAPDAAQPSERTCPSYDVPCDSMCWVLYFQFQFAGATIGDAGTSAEEADGEGVDVEDPNARDASVNEDAGVPATLQELARCALETAQACRAGDSGIADAGAADAAVQPAAANWASVVRDCRDKLDL